MNAAWCRPRSWPRFPSLAAAQPNLSRSVLGDSRSDCWGVTLRCAETVARLAVDPFARTTQGRERSTGEVGTARPRPCPAASSNALAPESIDQAVLTTLAAV